VNFHKTLEASARLAHLAININTRSMLMRALAKPALVRYK